MNASHEECGKELLEIGTQVKTQNKVRMHSLRVDQHLLVTF